MPKSRPQCFTAGRLSHRHHLYALSPSLSSSFASSFILILIFPLTGEGLGRSKAVVCLPPVSGSSAHEMPWQQANPDQTSYQVELAEGVPPFVHIRQNEFWGMKPKKLKDEDIVVCECKYDPFSPESACGESCLNVLTNTECTPGYCPCGEHCSNQKFQKCEYAETKLFKTEGRGWGLVANQKIKAGQFIIEYCGEVISSEVAKQRSQTYEAQGLTDAYIISLNANHFIDATKKGSLARFINHSCQPNCETRKWTVLGETRVGIFAKEDIACGTELAYDYNFEWYGGVTVRCLCGAANCSLFLGAKSHGFQQDLDYYIFTWYLYCRYTVENIPLYDSAEDEPFPRPDFTMITVKHESTVNDPSLMENGGGSLVKFEAASVTQSNYSVSPPMSAKPVAAERNKATDLSVGDKGQVFSQTNSMISRIRSNSACRNYNIGPNTSSKKRSQKKLKPRTKTFGRKQVSYKPVVELFASKKAREEIMRYEELKNEATSVLNSLYDEIRPAIEEHERDSQDSVSTSVAEKWIQATCSKWKAEFDFHFSIVKNVLCPPNEEANPSGSGEHLVQNEIKYLTH
ncbi:Histone-lysine N-methyltransferase ASHH1 [Striga hermonthica]|uniref:Histone-lysine N-methyltransferase ASHH1 n=1 Tax=Striga hermonthica TaxID=68872 RepID=A0A9N7R305_STRHE|nr:Histone-lysine N-methyltransferase ASHH1 [Striga hermonthica]